MKPQWKQQAERSNIFWIRLLLNLGTLFGRGFARLLLPFIVVYFLLFPGQSQHNSRRYLERVLQRPVGRWDVARHFHAFASTLLDRLFVVAGQEGDLHISNPDASIFDELACSRRGGLLMISHVGSFDMLRFAVTDRQDGLRLRVLMDLSQAASMNAVLKSLQPDWLDNIIDTSQCQGADLMLRIREELDQGALIGIMADRLHQADERAISAQFLGHRAQIPASPWLIASVMKVPVYMGLGLYLGGNRYRLHFEQLCDNQVAVARSQRGHHIQTQAQHYLQRLEHWLEQYPLNWFNFYDFWAESNAPAQSDAITS